MDAALPGLWSLSPIGAVIGMVVLIFIALTTGRLYTKGQHDQIVQLYKQLADEAKATATKWEGIAIERGDQLSLVLPQLQVFSEFIQRADRTGGSTPSKGHNGTVEGDPHVRT